MKTALEQNIRAIENLRIVLKGLVEKSKNVFGDIYGSERAPTVRASPLPVSQQPQQNTDPEHSAPAQ